MVVIVFDLETSGLNPYHDDIIEIGAKVLNTDNSFQCLVKPKSRRPISQKITDITGISNRLLRSEGKSWVNAYVEFFNWFREATKDQEVVLVSHNGDSFDFLFFKRMILDFKKEGISVQIDPLQICYHDTLLISKRLMNNRTYYNQASIAKSYGIAIEAAHRAMGDVLVLEQMYGKLMEHILKLEKIDGYKEIQKIRDYIDLNI